MEVVIPAAMDFDFNSARSSPRSTAPSTPTGVGGGCFFSAPTSPTRLSQFYRQLDTFSVMSDRQSSRRSNSLAAIPFDWEEKPGTPKSPRREEAQGGDDFAFAFAFSEALEKTSLPAEELFDGGKIKPLKPPPRLQVVQDYNQNNPLLSSPRSPKSPLLSQGKKFIRDAFSPRNKKDRDPFATAIETSRNQTDDHTRGRERVQDLSKNSSRRAARSLSPYRVSAYPWEEDDEEERKQKQKQNESSSNKPSTCSNKGSARKWRLRDIFLFRSASEGHATYKDRFWWYSSSFFKKPEDNKNSSSKSRDVSSGSDGSGRKVSENMNKKKKPCKQGILGRLAFTPGF